MAFRLKGKPQARPITAELARKFASMEPAPGDRLLSHKRRKSIETWLSSGTFKTAQWAVAYCDGKAYRVNGQHSSTVLASMNGTMPKGLVAVVEEYDCDTLDDVARLYATFDSRSSMRTTGDINRSFHAVTPALAEVPSRVANCCITGISFALWENTYTTHPAEERAALMESNSDFIVWVYLVLSGADSKHMLRGPVVAAMYRTYNSNRDLAEKFWTLVRDASGLKPTLPDRVLNKYLLVTRGCGARSGGVTGIECVTQREMYVKCLHAWNAWRSGGATNLKFHAGKPTPDVK